MAVCSAALMLGAPSAFGATPSTAYSLTSIDTPFPQDTGRFGERHAATNDIDRDGVNDYFVGALSETVGGINNAGRVYAISGRTRTEIYDLVAPEIQNEAKFGFFIAVLGDVNNDGHRDLAVGTDAQDTTAAGVSCTPPAAGCNDGQGKAWVFSGRKGGLLYPVNNPDPQAGGPSSSARFGSRIGRAGDVTGDGVPESIMGASGNDVPAGCGADGTVEPGCRVNQGQAYIFNGATGALFRTLNLPESDRVPATCSASCGGLGLSVQGPGDVDGDGVTDQLVTAGSLSLEADGDVCAAATPPTPGCNNGQGAMYLFSGQTGNLLARIDDPAPQAAAVFGFQDAAPLAPGDVNNDGRADIFANGFQQAGPPPASRPDEGRIWVFDGKATVDNPAAHGVVEYEPRDPTPTLGGQCCFSLDKTDYNKDRRPDLYVGQSPHHLSNPFNGLAVDQSGGTYVFDGRNGAPLKSLELPPSVAQRGVFENLGSNLGWSVAAPGDLNRDGEPDYLAGATFQDMGANKDEGKAFVFLSKVAAPKPPTSPAPTNCPAGNSAGVKCKALPGGGREITGTAGNNTIVGTNANDIIRCGDGDDVVSGGGGDDTIHCGDGNDRVSGNAGNDRLFGEAGNDRLAGNSGNDSLSGGSGNDRASGGSGRDRINGNRGDDVLHGNSNNDSISGSFGRDRISGNSGNDRLAGNSANDRISGDSGRDRISGGSGRDRLSGASGNDAISARDRTRDSVRCGRGRDRVSADRRRGRDRVARDCERVRRR